MTLSEVIRFENRKLPDMSDPRRPNQPRLAMFFETPPIFLKNKGSNLAKKSSVKILRLRMAISELPRIFVVAKANRAIKGTAHRRQK